MPTPLPYSDLEADAETARVKGDSARVLTQALITKPAETFAEMGNSFGVVRPTDITIEADGSLLIRDKTVATELAKRLSGVDPTVAFFDTNCSCQKS